jgi:hypothetical protein
MFKAALHLTITLFSNYPEIPGSCLADGLAFSMQVAKVFTDGIPVDSKKVSHLSLRQPHSVSIRTHV